VASQQFSKSITGQLDLTNDANSEKERGRRATGRVDDEQRRERGETGGREKRFSIFHFLFVIFYLGKRLGVSRGSAVEIENDK